MNLHTTAYTSVGTIRQVNKTSEYYCKLVLSYNTQDEKQKGKEIEEELNTNTTDKRESQSRIRKLKE